MPSLFDALMTHVPGYVLHVMRASGFVFFLPGLGGGSDARWLRLVLGVALGTIFFWVSQRAAEAVPITMHGVVHFFGLGLGELLLGAAVGYAVQLVSSVLAIAGEIIAQEMGFTLAQAMDPITGASTQVVSQFLSVLGVLTMFALDLHHDFLRALAAAFHAVPVGHGFDVALLSARHGTLVTLALETGVRYALPILAVMLVLTAALAVLSRAVPNINLMEFSFGVRILVALALALLLLTHGMPGLIASMRELTAGAVALLRN
jgi:flagellar biosynthesis protein FliR